MAAGSQKWNGMSADFENAPINTRTTAAESSAGRPYPKCPCWPAATISAREKDPPGIVPNMMMPMSIERPPNVVTMMACIAARRELPRAE